MPVTELIAPRSLHERIAQVTTLAGTEVASTAELGDLLSSIYHAILGTELDNYHVAAIKPQAPKLRVDLFALRILLRSRIAGWTTAGLMTHNTQAMVRDCLRAARFAGDMLGEVSIDCRQLPDGALSMKAFTGPINTFMNPAFDTDERAAFRSGDILLMRGMHHNSAAIARIGDVDSQFSHVCIIHIDRDGKQWVVESLIEDGAVINELGHVLTHGNGRAMLFRHPDRDLAARAAQIAYDHIKPTYRRWTRRILYDFTMRLDHRRPLFCSKLVRFAFDRASNGQIQLPTFKTRFTMKNRDFIDRIGVKATETYAPGDTEIEPHFELVAEWADLRVTSRLRAQDLIMVKLFEWMEFYGYAFQQDMLIRIIALLGRFSAHFSEDIKTMLSQTVPKVPINMPRKTIAAVAMLHKTAEPLLAEIRALEVDHIARAGLPLHPRQIYEALEGIRLRSDGRIGYLVAPGS